MKSKWANSQPCFFPVLTCESTVSWNGTCCAVFLERGILPVLVFLLLCFSSDPCKNEEKRLDLLYLDSTAVLYVKRSVSRDFGPPFFFMIRPIYCRPLINRLKYFRIWFRFRRDIRILKKLRGAHPITDLDSAVCIIQQSQTPRCASYRGVMKTKHLKKLRGVHPTAESDSAVCIIPRSQATRCASHR